MRKILLLFVLSFIFLLVGCSSTETEINSTNDINSSKTTNLTFAQPTTSMDLYGKIVSNEGNEFTILEVDTSKDPTFGMSSEDKKAYMMSLSQEQRMALKDEIRNAILGNVKVMIPVGIPILVKKEQGPEGKEEMGSLVDMEIGSYVSIWYNPEITDKNVAMYVKKSFTK